MNAEEITLDIGVASSNQSLHEIFAAALGFPDYYGMNWDAFWDCVTDPEQSTMPHCLILTGFSTLDVRLPNDARQLRMIVEDLKAERPEVEIYLYD